MIGTETLRRQLGNAIFVILLAAMLTFILAPLAWLLISSFSSARELTEIPPHWIPQQPYLQDYVSLITNTTPPDSNTALTSTTISMFRTGLVNSTIVSAGVVVICLLFGSLAAYSFVRLWLPGGGKMIYVLLLAQMLPVVAILIPLCQVITALGLLDKLPVVMFLLSMFHLPFVIWMLRGYFQTIPRELEEAAMVDGTTRVGALFKVVVPLSTPGLFAAGICTFLQSWNAFMIPLIFTSSDSTKTISLAIALFLGRHYTDYTLVSAAGVIASLPPILLALLFQRYLLAGLVAGGVKG